MAQSTKKTTSRRGTSTSKKTNSTSKKNNSSNSSNIDSKLKQEILVIVLFFVVLFLFLCLINVIGGAVGPFFKSLLVGVFGLIGYALPILLFLGLCFRISNKGNSFATYKLIAAIVLLLSIGVLLSQLTGSAVKDLASSKTLIKDLYDEKNGGGVVFGLIAVGLFKLMGNAGSILLAILLGALSGIVISGKSLRGMINKVKESFSDESLYVTDEDYDLEDISEEIAKQEAENKARASAREKARENARLEKARLDKEKEKQRRDEMLDDDRIVNASRKQMNISDFDIGISTNNSQGQYASKDDIHEITVNYNNLEADEIRAKDRPKNNEPEILTISQKKKDDYDISSININKFDSGISGPMPVSDETRELELKEPVADLPVIKSYDAIETEGESVNVPRLNDTPLELPKSITSGYAPVRKGLENGLLGTATTTIISDEVSSMPDPVTSKTHDAANANLGVVPQKPKKFLNYKLPGIDLLKLNNAGNKGDSDKELKETALKLQNTLKTFGVDVRVTDISQGPSVTRYELSLGEGVKVSKIVNLADDIKLNMAAQDIRIEAPIPGKAAVGIEIPNKETAAVLIRDILDSNEFKGAESNITFAVGKDISGKTIIADIAKMPHMLVAGATGAGKSVCINTLIMSILYKANPDDVKLIMIDPKVVELSVYNGIPHLLLPVVTDPKKASATLQWAVNEMTKRYNSFAAFGVRDLKGYNKQVEQLKKSNPSETAEKMAQIIVIVDELADLMMVASKEVEESICRLAQLARAAGIHLIIATQRPSVDVITGLIKANMPSRVAFKVTSGVDSRTILDTVGAEKLLGKGDMLFYPQGYTKPLRVQGAFVSDNEVNKVVDFLKNQNDNQGYDNAVEDAISNISSSSGARQSGDSSSDGQSNDYDQFFAEACRLVASKEKASSGMLQRVYKIGFNRAARIIDQMEEAGVVGPEEGTKPRRVLMSTMQVEELLSRL